jgi:hypothetical protein
MHPLARVLMIVIVGVLVAVRVAVRGPVRVGVLVGVGMLVRVDVGSHGTSRSVHHLCGRHSATPRVGCPPVAVGPHQCYVTSPPARRGRKNSMMVMKRPCQKATCTRPVKM